MQRITETFVTEALTGVVSKGFKAVIVYKNVNDDLKPFHDVYTLH